MDEQKPETTGTAETAAKSQPGADKPDTTGASNNEPKTADKPTNGTSTSEATAPPVALEQQLAEAKAEAARNLDGWQRAAAEFANYRKRIDKERAETYQLAAVETLKKLLPIVDDFDRAIQAVPPDKANGLAYDGLTLIHRKLLTLLESTGIKVVNPLGEPFNAAYHEANGQDERTGKPSGQVTAVLQKGYIYGDKVLRAALVRVAS